MTTLADILADEGLLSAEEKEVSNADTSFGTDGNWYDADTIHMNDGNNYRLVGYNAREVVNPFSGKAGDVGGREQTVALSKLARDRGFTNLVPTGEYDVDMADR